MCVCVCVCVSFCFLSGCARRMPRAGVARASVPHRYFCRRARALRRSIRHFGREQLYTSVDAVVSYGPWCSRVIVKQNIISRGPRQIFDQTHRSRARPRARRVRASLWAAGGRGRASAFKSISANIHFGASNRRVLLRVLIA